MTSFAISSRCGVSIPSCLAQSRERLAAMDMYPLLLAGMGIGLLGSVVVVLRAMAIAIEGLGLIR